MSGMLKEVACVFTYFLQKGKILYNFIHTCETGSKEKLSNKVPGCLKIPREKKNKSEKTQSSLRSQSSECRIKFKNHDYLLQTIKDNLQESNDIIFSSLSR